MESKALAETFELNTEDLIKAAIETAKEQLQATEPFL